MCVTTIFTHSVFHLWDQRFTPAISGAAKLMGIKLVLFPECSPIACDTEAYNRDDCLDAKEKEVH